MKPQCFPVLSVRAAARRAPGVRYQNAAPLLSSELCCATACEEVMEARGAAGIAGGFCVGLSDVEKTTCLWIPTSELCLLTIKHRTALVPMSCTCSACKAGDHGLLSRGYTLRLQQKRAFRVLRSFESVGQRKKRPA